LFYQELFEAHPRFAERFPGGFFQFVQLAAALPENELDDLFMNLHEIAGLGDGVMPGHMPEEELIHLDFGDEAAAAPRGEDLIAVPPGVVEPDQEDVPDGDDAESTEDEEIVVRINWTIGNTILTSPCYSRCPSVSSGT